MTTTCWRLRLALNEALYLKNEPPSVAPHSALLILLDSGIRLWGAPRVFAAAVALALLAKAPKRQEARSYRAQASGFAPIDLTRKPGLTEHLAALELNEHPGESLRRLVEQHSATPKQPVDLVVITHERALRDSGFRVPQNLADGVNVYLISVDRDGWLNLSLATSAGNRPLKRAKLDLERLLPKHSREVIDPHGRFPAIFDQEPFPFLLVPVDLNTDANVSTKDYSVGISGEGTVWYWHSTKMGARQLKAPALAGSLISIERDDDASCLVVLKYRSGALHLLRWFDRTPEPPHVSVITEVPCKPKSIFRRNGLLYILYRDLADIVELSTGQILARAPMPGSLDKIGEGFYRVRGQTIGVIMWNGKGLVWEPLRPEIPKAKLRLGKVIQVFHRQGIDGPWMIDEWGNVQQTCEPYQHLKVELGEGGLHGISRDGHTIRSANKKIGNFSISLNDKVRSPLFGTQAYVSAPQWALRRNFTHIAAVPSGHLMLRTRKGYWVRLQLDEKRGAICFSPPERASFRSLSRVAFKSCPSPAGSGFHLNEAIWPESGSRAILDRRGLLHLMSANSRIPEVSIVMAESTPLPVWSSDGCLIGPAFFVGKGTRTGDAVRIDGILRAFVEGLK